MSCEPRYSFYFRTCIYPIIRSFVFFFDFGAEVRTAAIFTHDDKVGVGNEMRFYGAEGVEGGAGEAAGSDVSVGFEGFAEPEETEFGTGLFMAPGCLAGQFYPGPSYHVESKRKSFGGRHLPLGSSDTSEEHCITFHG